MKKLLVAAVLAMALNAPPAGAFIESRYMCVYQCNVTHLQSMSSEHCFLYHLGWCDPPWSFDGMCDVNASSGSFKRCWRRLIRKCRKYGRDAVCPLPPPDREPVWVGP